MAEKVAVPEKHPKPKLITPEEKDDRALQLAAVALLERLTATDNDTGEVGVQALIWNLQNLMRLFDRPTMSCDIQGGAVVFNRTVTRGDWENGDWHLKWTVDNNGE